jgi:hypothetical protein
VINARSKTESSNAAQLRTFTATSQAQSTTQQTAERDDFLFAISRGMIAYSLVWGDFERANR